MAADLHIHVLTEGTTEEEVRTLKGPLFTGNSDAWERACEHVSNTPDIWIGEVSWLKAALTGDSETFVPDTVGAVQSIIGDTPVELTEDMLSRILSAFNTTNTTGYDVTERDKVGQFLRSYLGQKVFTVSW